MKNNLFFVLILGVLVFMAVGCSKDTKGRLSLQGTVTCDGTPIADGTITFVPSEQSAADNRTGAEIIEGKYEIDAMHGLVPGSYRVLVTSSVPTGKTIDPYGVGPEPEMTQGVAPEFNENSTLTATVEAGKKNVLDFEVKARTDIKK